jgi:pimeloyl-ACP methyl ester carboxylesterase
MVVFSHSGFVDHTMFSSQVPALAQHYRVLTWDMRGHGLSQPLRGTLSYRGAGEDIVALLGQMEVEQAILVGASMGGCAAQEVVFHHPERVIALALIGCPCITVQSPKSMEFFSKISLAIIGHLPEKILKRYILGSINMSLPSTVPEVQAYIREKAKLISKPTFIAMYQSVLNGFHDEPDYRIDQPLLLVHGDHDSPPIQQQAPIWAERDPNCRYEVIPDAGHNANQDNPVVFNKLLGDFLCEHT